MHPTKFICYWRHCVQANVGAGASTATGGLAVGVVGFAEWLLHLVQHWFLFVKM